jgi:hypothetical protein
MINRKAMPLKIDIITLNKRKKNDIINAGVDAE